MKRFISRKQNKKQKRITHLIENQGTIQQKNQTVASINKTKYSYLLNAFNYWILYVNQHKPKNLNFDQFRGNYFEESKQCQVGKKRKRRPRRKWEEAVM